MSSDAGDSLTSLFAKADAGDARARDQRFATLYDELHRLAEAQLHRSQGPITLGPTTLLHEAYLQVSNREPLPFPDRNRFFGYAARAMRGLIINYVRDRRAQKRGGALTFTSLDDANVAAATPSEDLEQLHHALEELAALEPTSSARAPNTRSIGIASPRQRASSRPNNGPSTSCSRSRRPTPA
jgi:RNA polymerase sigma factor (TIGR02999 family)